MALVVGSGGKLALVGCDLSDNKIAKTTGVVGQALADMLLDLFDGLGAKA